tara:strand:- start:1023 stop:1646 length:624 start_codon:yes stop_codon:yes gene_type:complete
MKFFKLNSSILVIIPLLFFGNTAVYSEELPPEKVILSAANDLFLDVEKNKSLYEEDITVFYERVDNILTPIVDFDVLIKSIIGKKNYQSTSDDLKNRFKLALKGQLIRIYAKTIIEYSNSKITIIDSTKNKSFYLVKTELSIGPGKPSFQVIYVMKKSDNKWKIVEVVANGLRLVKSLRKSLLPEIEEKGIEAVITRLESDSIKSES